MVPPPDHNSVIDCNQITLLLFYYEAGNSSLGHWCRSTRLW